MASPGADRRSRPARWAAAPLALALPVPEMSPPVDVSGEVVAAGGRRLGGGNVSGNQVEQPARPADWPQATPGALPIHKMSPPNGLF